jgi:hypothetical protein
MQATFDEFYQTPEILEALARNEQVTISYHGQLKGVLIPLANPLATRVQDHPFFGMRSDDHRSVTEIMKQLRGESVHEV